MDLRNAKAKARDAWMETPEGLACLEGSAQGQYLKNRVERAFCDGWDAAEKQKIANPNWCPKCGKETKMLFPLVQEWLCIFCDVS